MEAFVAPASSLYICTFGVPVWGSVLYDLFMCNSLNIVRLRPAEYLGVFYLTSWEWC